MAVGTIEDILADMKNGVYDFTVDGKCSSCGQCCSNFLPVSQKEIKQIRRYIEKHKIKECRHLVPLAHKVFDWTCPFRNNTERKCEIYPVRPAICRDFQCDKPRKGIEADKRLFREKYGVVFMRETFFPKS